jgi:hypothetical protein
MATMCIGMEMTKIFSGHVGRKEVTYRFFVTIVLVCTGEAERLLDDSGRLVGSERKR